MTKATIIAWVNRPYSFKYLMRWNLCGVGLFIGGLLVLLLNFLKHHGKPVFCAASGGACHLIRNQIVAHIGLFALVFGFGLAVYTLILLLDNLNKHPH